MYIETLGNILNITVELLLIAITNFNYIIIVEFLPNFGPRSKFKINYKMNHKSAASSFNKINHRNQSTKNAFDRVHPHAKPIIVFTFHWGDTLILYN